jgi:hypothetical protein
MLILSRLFVAISLALAVLAGSGCSRPAKKPAAVKVTAKVLFRQSTPANGAFVVFHPTNPELEKQMGGRPFGYVMEDGTVSLTTYQQGDGAPEGEYGVTVVWETKGDPKGGLAFEGGGVAASDKLEGRYGNPTAPKIKATVKSGQANDFTFVLD